MTKAYIILLNHLVNTNQMSGKTGELMNNLAIEITKVLKD